MKLPISGPIRGATAVLILLLSLGAATARAAGTAPPYHTRGAPAVAPPARPLNIYQRDLLDRYIAGTTASSVDTLRVIAFQVQFSDSLMGGQPGSHRSEVRDSVFFTHELEHLNDYYRGASRGRFEVSWTLDPTLYTLPKEMGYYGRDAFEETRVVELTATLVAMADAAVDFSKYDHVFVIHAGAGQETDLGGDSRGQIWSSFYDSSDIDAAYPDSTVAGIATNDSSGGAPVLVNNFSIVPANSSQDFNVVGTLGIWAFEIGNRIGLLPMFDSTPPNVPDSQGIGSFGMMSFGLFNAAGFIPSFPCAFNRAIAGWVDPVTVEPTAMDRTVRLSDINSGADTDTLCVKIPITESEYYLVVNRVHDTNFDSLFTFVDRDSNLIPDNTDSLGGAEFDFFMTDLTSPFVVRYLPAYGFDVTLRHTGSGVYIWHIDEDVVRETLAAGYLPNDFVDRKSVDLEEADGVQDMDGGGDPYFALGSYWDSYRAGDDNQSAFGPDTKPSSTSNAGIRTGIVVDDISVPGPVMTCHIRLDNGYADHRARWDASSAGQPASVVDLDNTGGPEIVVLSDSGTVYVLNNTGAEYVDGDADPSTLAPYIVADGAEWVGPPAFADLDGGGDVELVAASAEGRLYAWKSTGAEVVDGDFNAGTQGVLYDAGRPIVAPPMLVDINDDGSAPEAAVVESDGDTLQIWFVDAGGGVQYPIDGEFGPLWPVRVQGQMCAPLALAGTSNARSAAKRGVVFAWVDTLASRAAVSYVPAYHPGGGILVSEPVAKTWTAAIPIPNGVAASSFQVSAPAVGDIDRDGEDEVVVTTSDGRLYIFQNDAGETGIVDPVVVTLRAAGPSAPALGDVDLDGTLEIAVWDAEYMYLFESNGRLVTEWPKLIVEPSAGEQPPMTPVRALESAVIADLDGDGTVDVLFPLEDGSLRAFGFDGRAIDGFPRVGPAGIGAAPTVAPVSGGGDFSLVVAGTVSPIRAIDTVVDTLVTGERTAVSIQSLPGSSTAGRRFWSSALGGPERQGRVEDSAPLKTAAALFDEGTFMLYPNPVVGPVVNVRVMLNARATVRVNVYNLEGEETFSRAYTANGNDLIGTPFDEPIDVSGMVSGVYFVRVRVEGDGGSGKMIKPFAIRR